MASRAELLISAVLLWAGPLAALPAADGGAPRVQSPFLEEFYSRGPVRVALETVDLGAAEGSPREGLLARPEMPGPLPALLVIGPVGALPRRALSELAEVGYLTLGVPAARGRSGGRVALEWLRKRPDVSRDRIGLVDLGGGPRESWTLAREERLQACVVVCQPEELPPPGVRADGPPLLAVLGPGGGSAPGAGGRGIFKLVSFASEAPGFLHHGSPATPHHEAEAAWFEIYEFLGAHVEDAGERRGATDHSLRVIDLMRAVNSQDGARGQLAAALRDGPLGDREWDLARARAALLAEAARILEGLPPPRGSAADWRQRASAFRSGAGLLLERVAARDLEGSRTELERLSAACGACHQAHR